MSTCEFEGVSVDSFAQLCEAIEWVMKLSFKLGGKREGKNKTENPKQHLKMQQVRSLPGFAPANGNGSSQARIFTLPFFIISEEFSLS